MDPEGRRQLGTAHYQLSTSLSWTFVDGGPVDLTSYVGNKVKIAFKYTSTATKAGTWEVDKFSVAEKEDIPVVGDEVTDVITAADLAATTSSYVDFSGVKKESDAVYAGQTAKDASGNIQMRSKNSNSGIVSTTSGGTVKSVKITVGSGANTVEVYGSNTAYTSAADLYATSGNTNQGTKIGTLTDTGTIVFTEDYKYVGIRSNNGAIYLSQIEITWATE